MKKFLVLIALVLGISLAILLLNRNDIHPNLKGFYQSESTEDGYMVQLSFDTNDNTFFYYIDNRLVDQGMFSEKEENTYLLTGEEQQLTIHLEEDDRFDIIIPKINDGKPITLENMGKTPTIFVTEFDDVEQYKALLAE